MDRYFDCLSDKDKKTRNSELEIARGRLKTCRPNHFDHVSVQEILLVGRIRTEGNENCDEDLVCKEV